MNIVINLQLQLLKEWEIKYGILKQVIDYANSKFSKFGGK